MNQGFAVVDFETTGLSPAKGDRAIEIGLVHVAPDGTLEDEHETLIHVDRSVGASWVHHITARDLTRRISKASHMNCVTCLPAACSWPTTCRSTRGSCSPNTRA